MTLLAARAGAAAGELHPRGTALLAQLAREPQQERHEDHKHHHVAQDEQQGFVLDPAEARRDELESTVWAASGGHGKPSVTGSWHGHRDD